jgi:hypothetical protein
MSVWDLYALKHPGSPACPQPHRLRYLVYAMALVADKIEAQKFGIQPKDSPQQPQGVDLRMPGGMTGFKPTGRQ